MKKFCTFFTLVSLTFFISVIAAFASEPEGIHLTKSSSGYLLEFSLPQYELTPVYTSTERFLQLSVPGYGVTPKVGLPALPLISFNIFIAYNELQPEAEVLSVRSEEKILDGKIYPFQEPWEKDNPLSDRPFTINSDYYRSTGGANKSVITISQPFIVAGVKGVIVTIYPFSYNPSENKLSVIIKGTFEIKLDSPVSPVTNVSRTYDQFFKNIFANYTSAGSYKGMNYLIITDPQFETTMQQFVDYKTGRGFNVEMFNTGTTGTTSATIKSFIQGRYDNTATRPDFILLVGDVGQIPAWTGSGEGTPTTDLNYAQLEGGDYFADAFIGRFSVSNTDELQNAINKSIFMESYVGSLGKKNIFMASTDNYSISEGTHNFVIDSYFDPEGYTNLKLYTHTNGATTQQLIDALNDNQLFAVYSGHGGEYSWADGPVMSQSQVRDLTNTWYPFVFSFACVTGSYQVSESFGETWLRTEHGASTFYGSSVNSYWDEDDILEKKIFYSLFEDDLTRITPMFDQGKFYLVDYFGGITGTTLRYMEMYNLMGDPSMPVVITVPPDATPPDPVTDLTAASPTSNSITLNWTAPYDSTFGGIATYDIRYSLSMINSDEDFNSASQKLLTGQSDTAGTLKSFEIDGLDFDQTYYFSIKAKDIFNNASTMSNVAIENTLIAPTMSLSCDSMHYDASKETHKDSVVISNISLQSSTLDYGIELTNSTFPDKVSVTLIGMNDLLVSTKGETKDNPVKSFGYSFKGNGGPDSFGYTWIDSNEPGGPDYVWNDISSTGTEVTNWTPTGSFNPKDEGIAGPFQIGFDFKFYGVVKTQVYVNSNGLVLFGSISENVFTNDPIPTTDTPNDILAPLWDDLDGSSQGTVYYQQIGNKFIIQFTNWQRYYASGSSLTFQVVLQSNNRISYYYENLVGDLTACTVGIENNDGSDGLQVAYDAAYLENHLAVQIASDPEWLFPDHFAGRLYNGNSAAVILDFVTDDCEPGDYSMDMVITSNDPVNSTVTIPVTMTVSVIPVELTSFTAESSGDEVVIKWSTATETNNRGFEIEKTVKSKNKSQSDWTKVQFVEGKGTTTERSSYVYNEKVTSAGTYVYRLKQIDFDGTVSYSPEVEVGITGPKEFSLYQNYPNPFNPATTIKFALPEKTNLVISVYNLVGEKVAEVFKGELDGGYHEVSFNASALSSGVYFYRFESNKFSSVKKMLLLR